MRRYSFFELQRKIVRWSKHYAIHFVMLFIMQGRYAYNSKPTNIFIFMVYKRIAVVATHISFDRRYYDPNLSARQQ